MENYGIKSLLLIERFFLGHQVANLQRTWIIFNQPQFFCVWKPGIRLLIRWERKCHEISYFEIVELQLIYRKHLFLIVYLINNCLSCWIHLHNSKTFSLFSGHALTFSLSYTHTHKCSISLSLPSTVYVCKYVKGPFGAFVCAK
jgi:hypothetical protein